MFLKQIAFQFFQLLRTFVIIELLSGLQKKKGEDDEEEEEKPKEEKKETQSEEPAEEEEEEEEEESGEGKDFSLHTEL